jgi:hypothetical protein
MDEARPITRTPSYQAPAWALRFCLGISTVDLTKGCPYAPCLCGIPISSFATGIGAPAKRSSGLVRLTEHDGVSRETVRGRLSDPRYWTAVLTHCRLGLVFCLPTVILCVIRVTAVRRSAPALCGGRVSGGGTGRGHRPCAAACAQANG